MITSTVQPSRRRLLLYLATMAVAASSCRCLAGPTTLNMTSQREARHEQNLFWENYKATFIRNLGRGSIIVDPLTNLAPSEAMGHGLIFAAEREDWATFDTFLQGLSYFRKANGLFRWKINPDGTVPPNDNNLASASETEQNVTYALLLAYEKTGQNRYRNMARHLLTSVWQHEVVNFQGRLIFMPGDRTDNSYWPINETTNELVWNPSYFSPHLYRKFAEYDESHDWDKLINDGYYLINETLRLATNNPEEFGITGINPMPAWVWLTPHGNNDLNVRSYYPNIISATEIERSSNEWDTIRIPIYLAIDTDHAEAINFLGNFFSVVQINRPEDAIIGRGRTGPTDQGYNSEMAIAAYATGLNALGRETTSFMTRLNINNRGFITATRNSYYDQTICYYSWLQINGLFPN